MVQELGQKSHRRTNSRFSMLKRHDFHQGSRNTAVIHQQVMSRHSQTVRSSTVSHGTNKSALVIWHTI